jgi:AcrR family transcriptional regulator
MGRRTHSKFNALNCTRLLYALNSFCQALLVVAPEGPEPAHTGRRPGPTATREAILAAAREAFAAEGYGRTSLRSIARRAGVHPSLVVHFYGSKGGLLGAAIQWPFDPDVEARRVLAAGPEHIGERLARTFIAHWENAEERSPIIALLHAATADPGAAALMREFMTARLLLPLMEHIDADRPALRAGLLAAQLLGFGLGRYVIGLDGLANTAEDDLVAALGPTLQRLCTEPLHVPR